MLNKKIKRNKKKDYIAIGITIVILIIMLFIGKGIYNNTIYKNVPPSIELIGDKVITVNINEQYLEKGVKAYDYIDKDLSKDVIIKGKVDVQKVGTYLLHYTVKNSRNIESEEIVRLVKVIDGSISNDKNKSDESESQNKKKSNDQLELNEVIEEVIDKHKSELAQFDNDTCKMVDYLTPYINAYYDEDEYPEREVLRPMVKESLASIGIE